MMEYIRADGVEPEKPYSGKFNLRISPELHRQAAVASARRGVSLNKFIEKAIKDELIHA